MRRCPGVRRRYDGHTNVDEYLLMAIYLHHYPASLFSEKIRLLLGYLQCEWHSVIIPSIMPRPLLMPLTGGYRKTPVLQIDANVYCDTNVIARALARERGNTTLFAPGFAADRVAEWADSQLFRVTVALNFAPEAVATMMQALPAEDVAAFQKDRAELSAGATLTAFPPDAARAYLRHYLAGLEDSLRGSTGFLFGAQPCIADFSLYHCLWFLRNNSINAPLLEGYSNLNTWYDAMARFGHGTARESSGEQALAHARASEPVLPRLADALPQGFAVGDEVRVTPVDYGRIPVAGRLRSWTVDEIVIERTDREAGRVFCHFPSPGFVVEAAA
jgi:glutathione S-transferase